DLHTSLLIHLAYPTLPSFDLYYKDSNHSMKLGNLLYSLTPRQDRPIIILSVGTDRSTVDSLGPFVGSYLKDHCKPQSIKIYGTRSEEQTSELQSRFDLVSRLL